MMKEPRSWPPVFPVPVQLARALDMDNDAFRDRRLLRYGFVDGPGVDDDPEGAHQTRVVVNTKIPGDVIPTSRLEGPGR